MRSPIVAGGNRPVITEVPGPAESPAPVTCPTCGETVAPDGVCLDIGACAAADRAATRDASRGTWKFRVAPAAWNVRGGVD